MQWPSDTPGSTSNKSVTTEVICWQVEEHLGVMSTRWGVAAIRLGTLAQRLWTLATSLYPPASILGAPWIAEEQSGNSIVIVVMQLGHLEIVANSHQQNQISVQTEWLSQSGCALSELSETSRWRLTLRTQSMTRVALHSVLRLQLHHYLVLCLSAILNEHSGSVANGNHKSEWVHWVCTGIMIPMWWVTLQKPLLAFLLPTCKMQFSLD